jgi:hypothetical protein
VVTDKKAEKFRAVVPRAIGATRGLGFTVKFMPYPETGA